MLRRHRARGALVVSLLLAAGCQDYNFNPVGHCLIQPGTRRVTLSNVSTADVLFVVDESGSMRGEQEALANNFDAFINNLNQANVARAANGLEPIDFHLAITTTSIFFNEATTQTCRTDCPGAQGQAVCCTTANTPARGPRACAGPGAACPVAGTTCRLDCNQLQGEFYCCAGDGTFPGGSNPGGALSELVPCDPGDQGRFLGTLCGTLQSHYDARSGTPPFAPAADWAYPKGDFVSTLVSGTPNPRVLHFDKELYRNGTNRQGYTGAQLVDWFKQNVQVGTSGSGQEQALQAGRLAIQKALAGQQKDTRNDAGAVVWTPPSATAVSGSAPARWPNAGSKLVLVFVGDEDDCSSPADPAGGVVWLPQDPGVDACVRDGQPTDIPDEQRIRNKQYAVQEFVDYFTGLGRPVAAGFILPAAQNSCTLDGASGTTACTTAGLCCGPTGICTSTTGAQARGVRLLDTAQALSRAKVEVVAGSICDPNFGTILNDIAEIVKPPSGLELPTMPAEDEVTVLRIGTASATRKICSRPAPPAPPGRTLAQQQDEIDPSTGKRYDWWFTLGGAPGLPVTVSQFVYINPKGSCVANPGETYSADYLGQLPAGGCQDDAQCQTTLGGAAGSWTCFSGMASDGTCTPSSFDAGSSRWSGTCICGARSTNCPHG